MSTMIGRNEREIGLEVRREARQHTIAHYGAPVLAQMWRLRIALVLYAALNLGDIVSTAIGLSGGLREGNPLMSSLLAQHGFGALIAYKVLVVVGVSVGVALLGQAHHRIARVTLMICNTLVGLAVLLNVVQFLFLR